MIKSCINKPIITITKLDIIFDIIKTIIFGTWLSIYSQELASLEKNQLSGANIILLYFFLMFSIVNFLNSAKSLYIDSTIIDYKIVNITVGDNVIDNKIIDDDVNNISDFTLIDFTFGDFTSTDFMFAKIFNYKLIGYRLIGYKFVDKRMELKKYILKTHFDNQLYCFANLIFNFCQMIMLIALIPYFFPCDRDHCYGYNDLICYFGRTGATIGVGITFLFSLLIKPLVATTIYNGFNVKNILSQCLIFMRNYKNIPILESLIIFEYFLDEYGIINDINNINDIDINKSNNQSNNQLDSNNEHTKFNFLPKFNTQNYGSYTNIEIDTDIQI